MTSRDATKCYTKLANIHPRILQVFTLDPWARILIASQRRRSPAIRNIGVADIESYSLKIAREISPKKSCDFDYAKIKDSTAYSCLKWVKSSNILTKRKICVRKMLEFD